MTATLTRAIREDCIARGHPYDAHHHHCYHCGRMSERHHSWCPDFGSRPDAGLVGFWASSVRCRS